MNFFTISAKHLCWIMRLWPPFWFTGIRIEYISDDFRQMRVAMPLRFYNKNVHGIHFGGSLYAMTDPCYLMMVLRNLGQDYRVLDKAGAIDYINKGTGKVSAELTLTDEDLKDIYKQTENGQKYLKNFTIHIRDEDHELVAQVERTVYIRQKRK